MVTREVLERWYRNGSLTNKAQIDTIYEELKKWPRAYTVAVNSEGISADRIDLYVVIARDENEAMWLAEREHRGDFPSYSVSESEVYPLGLDDARVLGRLVNEDGS